MLTQGGADGTPVLMATRGPVGTTPRNSMIVGAVLGGLVAALILVVVLFVALLAAQIGKGPFENHTTSEAFLKLLLPSPPFSAQWQESSAMALVVILPIFAGAMASGALGGRSAWHITPKRLFEYYRGYVDGWH